jgi:hypothetical protein
MGMTPPEARRIGVLSGYLAENDPTGIAYARGAKYRVGVVSHKGRLLFPSTLSKNAGNI